MGLSFFLINRCFRSHIKILLIKQASSSALDLSHRHRLPPSQLKWCNVITFSSGFLSLIDCDCRHNWALSIPISPIICSCVELSHWWWDSAPTHSEDISGHYAWVPPSRHSHVTLGPESRHDNNPIWMRHGIWHGHVLDIWPCVLLLQSPALPRYLGWWPFLHYHPYCCTAICQLQYHVLCHNQDYGYCFL